MGFILRHGSFLTVVRQQPFTKVTLQMSHNTVPTIPFVLPLYQKMDKHLEAVSISWKHSFKIQEAARQGLAKLRKYSTPAKLHHSYILGTGKFSSYYIYMSMEISFLTIVLHPCLRSHWFSTTADPLNAGAQEEAIKTAEDIFGYVAGTYLEAQTSSDPTIVPTGRPMANPVTKTPSFLASACSFQRPNTAATRIPVLKRTPLEELANELTRYFNFEAAPMEREGEVGDSDPSVQDILLNPLLWWKVSTYLISLLPF